ncbi:MAG: PAS domain S-box protein [Proteobacteria bacterium]|nr:PAS domain S-box protein [Pseudomonadota bacterium]
MILSRGNPADRGGADITAEKSKEALVLELEAAKKEVVRLEEKVRVQAGERASLAGYLRGLMASVTDSVAFFNREGRLTHVNPAFTKRFQIPCEEIIGKTVAEIVHPFFSKQNVDMLTKRLRDRLASGESSPLAEAETVLGPVQYSATVVKNDSGDVEGVIISVRDISEIRKTEESLRESEEKFRMISEQSLMGISIIQDNRVVYINEMAAKITGSTREELLQSSPEAFLMRVYPEDLPMIIEAVKSGAQASDSEKVLQLSFRAVGKNGELKWVEQLSKRVSYGGKPAIMNVGLDVTKRKQLEEAAVQSEKMLSLSWLAAGIAHEINNPLAAILQNAQIIRMRLAGDMQSNLNTAEHLGISMETVRQYMEKRKIFEMLDRVTDSGTRAAKIVTNMLSFARKPDEAKSSYSLSELLDETVELEVNDYDLEKKYDFKRIKITREYDPLAPLVPCEASKMQQVFFNLLKNSAEALSEEKSDDREPSLVLRVVGTDRTVRVEIEDNGPGISEELVDHIFEPFYTTKPKGKGTGLGLPLAYFIITEHHNGSMKVESVPEGGTRFIIELPSE